MSSPEKTRKHEIRPANGSATVLKTNADVPRRPERRRLLRRRRDALDEQVEQRVRAEVLRRDAARDRVQLVARDRVLERGGDVVRVELLAARGSAPSAPRRSRRRRRAASRGTRRPPRPSSPGSARARPRARRRDPCTRSCGAGRRCRSARARRRSGAGSRRSATESCSCSAASMRKKSARSRSSMFTNTTRESSSSSARFHTRAVLTSTPITPETTTSAPSTTCRPAIVSAWNPLSPGVSIRLILRPCHSTWQSDAASDICRRCSSSSQSETVVPASTAPRRFVSPAWNSIASTSEVFPVPRWPTTATLRIFPGSCGMPQLLLGEWSWPRSILVPPSGR